MPAAQYGTAPDTQPAACTVAVATKEDQGFRLSYDPEDNAQGGGIADTCKKAIKAAEVIVRKLE